LKNIIKLFEDTHTTINFIYRLKEIVEEYNNAYHGSIKNDICGSNTRKEPGEGMRKQYAKYDTETVKQSKYKVGIIVCTSVDKGALDKETFWKWTTEKFTIVGGCTHVHNPPIYRIRQLSGEKEDISGGLTVRNQKQAYVEYPDREKAWVKAELTYLH
jgi:hypothetical protein